MIQQKLNKKIIKKEKYLKEIFHGDWGLGIGDWGVGVLGQDPKPKNQKPNTKNHQPKKKKIIKK